MSIPITNGVSENKKKTQFKQHKQTCFNNSVIDMFFLLDKIILQDSHENCGKKTSQEENCHT
jgi:hypothetical protein